MRKQIDNKRITVFPEGRITSSNADEFEAEINNMLGHDDTELVIDAGDVEYVSSAGLRVLLKLSKRLSHTVTVMNVNKDLYDIFDDTGFTNILNIEKKMRTVSVDGCEMIGEGAFGKVYRIDEDTIVKVYEGEDSLPLIRKERQRSKQAFIKGIPTAISYDIVRVGNGYGSVFEMIKANNLCQLIINDNEHMDEHIAKYVQLIKKIHEIEIGDGELPQAVDVFVNYTEELKGKVPDDVLSGMRKLLAEMPQSNHIVHGDLHVKNVMVTEDEPLVIDMETVAAGAPIFDLQALFVAYIAYNEDDHENSLHFMGLSEPVCNYIWDRLMKLYFERLDEEQIKIREDKIKLLGYLNFLYKIEILNLTSAELKEVRSLHTVEKMRELLKRVDSLL